MRQWGCALALLLLPAIARGSDPTHIVVGAKKFTEGAVLGEIMAQALERQLGISVQRRFNLAGTQVAFDGLRSGSIDVYAEYTGTGLRDILGDAQAVDGAADAFARVSTTFAARYDLVWMAPFGFNNTYVLLMRREHAAQLGVQTISQLATQTVRYGMTHEFLERRDGLSALRAAYDLSVASVVGMEHDLAYRALTSASIDVTDGYSTDAKILTLDLLPLEDDRHFFPPYEAAPLLRGEVLRRRPEIAAVLGALAGRIDDAAMRQLNFEVEGERQPAAVVAQRFLARLGLDERRQITSVRSTSLLGTLWSRRHETLRLSAWHLTMAALAEVLACAVAIPVGVLASRRAHLATLALGGAGILQTIPALALLAFMLPLFGIGARPAIAALFLYGLLPVLRNTITGLRSLSPQLLEVATGLGMTRRQRLFNVELPLASPMILAGVRTSMVINIGTATLAALIGAGGLGEPIVTGLSVTDNHLVLSGALPAAVLAIMVDALLGWMSFHLIPRGLRLRSEVG